MTSRHTSAAVPFFTDPLANGKQCALLRVINIWETLFWVRVGFFVVIVLNWIQVLLWVYLVYNSCSHSGFWICGITLEQFHQAE